MNASLIPGDFSGKDNDLLPSSVNMPPLQILSLTPKRARYKGLSQEVNYLICSFL